MEGNVRRVAKFKATCDEKGNARKGSKILGKVRLLLPEEREEPTSPFLPTEKAISIPWEAAVHYEGSAPGEMVPALCTFQIQRMGDGDSWKRCKTCRAVIHQISIQLFCMRGAWLFPRQICHF